jgi:hypothetical protein
MQQIAKGECENQFSRLTYTENYSKQPDAVTFWERSHRHRRFCRLPQRVLASRPINPIRNRSTLD